MTTDEEKALYAGAVNYADAAQLVFAHPSSSGRDGLILPTHTLIGLSIELGFKAVFLHRGGDPKELKKVNVRHNLAEVRTLCVGLGFTSTVPQIDQIVDVIGDNYAAHEYRYMKPGTTLRYVEGAGAVRAIQQFVDEVARELDLPIRPERN